MCGSGGVQLTLKRHDQVQMYVVLAELVEVGIRRRVRVHGHGWLLDGVVFNGAAQGVCSSEAAAGQRLLDLLLHVVAKLVRVAAAHDACLKPRVPGKLVIRSLGRPRRCEASCRAAA